MDHQNIGIDPQDIEEEKQGASDANSETVSRIRLSVTIIDQILGDGNLWNDQ